MASPSNAAAAASSRAAGAGLVLLTLASGQFLMTLDSSVMNVSIATVAEDVGTTVSGIQGAITAYTLVMAALMITGAKVGAMIGRKRAFAIGCIIYGCGSFITSIAQNLPTLLFGWSFLEGVGAALILPAIVALVAGNFPAEARPKAYGLVAAAGAIAVAVGPADRRLLHDLLLLALGVRRRGRDRARDPPPHPQDRRRPVRAAAAPGRRRRRPLRARARRARLRRPPLERVGLDPAEGGRAVLVRALADDLADHHRPLHHLALLPLARPARVEGQEPLIRPDMLRNRQLGGGLIMFFFQFLVQAGVFFVVPLYLSVCLGLSAIDTGVRILPLSITLLAAAILIPRLWPNVSPRLVVRAGLLALLAGTLVLLAKLSPDAGAEIVLVPLLLIGLGIGALASQLGAVTVSAVPDDQAPEVGGVQNTATNLGASIGTALAGSVMLAAVAASFATNIQNNPDVPDRVKSEASVKLEGGVPFISDDDFTKAMDEAGVSKRTTDAVLTDYQSSRIDGLEVALAILAIMAVLALFASGRIPTTQPGRAPPEAEAAAA